MGIIPGPKQLKDFDSFLWPAIEEAHELAAGISAYDVIEDQIFTEHAYLCLFGGDIPAVSKAWLHMKGHNGICPCRQCRALAVRPPVEVGTCGRVPYYIPLRRPAGYPPPHYNVDSLPLCTHSQFIRHAERVTSAKTQTESEQLARYYGIKSLPILSQLGSVSLPRSFPYDFMHLLENVMEILMLHWTGKFKALDSGQGTYEIPKAVWEKIGHITLESNATIPSAFGRRLLNIHEDRPYYTAEAWLVWSTLLAPELLHDRLDTRYFKHFLRFVGLVKLTISFEYTRSDLEVLKDGWGEWLKDYEKRVYSYFS